MTLLIRPATPDDLVWVRSSWQASYREHTADRDVRDMPEAEYGHRWWRLLNRMLVAGQCIVAVHSDRPDIVLGWCCYQGGDPLRIHYVHVRKELQRRHIARDLLDHAGADATRPLLYSHRTTCSDMVQKPAHWEWQPWLLLGV